MIIACHQHDLHRVVAEAPLCQASFCGDSPVRSKQCSMNGSSLTMTPSRVVRQRETKVTPAKHVNPVKKTMKLKSSVSKVKAGLTCTDAPTGKKKAQKSLTDLTLTDLISEGSLQARASFSIFKGRHELSLREVIHGWWY